MTPDIEKRIADLEARLLKYPLDQRTKRLYSENVLLVKSQTGNTWVVEMNGLQYTLTITTTQP